MWLVWLLWDQTELHVTPESWQPWSRWNQNQVKPIRTLCVCVCVYTCTSGEFVHKHACMSRHCECVCVPLAMLTPPSLPPSPPYSVCVCVCNSHAGSRPPCGRREWAAGSRAQGSRHCAGRRSVAMSRPCRRNTSPPAAASGSSSVPTLTVSKSPLSTPIPYPVYPRTTGTPRVKASEHLQHRDSIKTTHSCHMSITFRIKVKGWWNGSRISQNDS